MYLDNGKTMTKVRIPAHSSLRLLSKFVWLQETLMSSIFVVLVSLSGMPRQVEFHYCTMKKLKHSKCNSLRIPVYSLLMHYNLHKHGVLINKDFIAKDFQWKRKMSSTFLHNIHSLNRSSKRCILRMWL